MYCVHECADKSGIPERQTTMTGASVNFKAVKSAGHAVSHASREVAPTYLLPSDKSMGTVVLLDDKGKVSQVLDAKMALASPRAKVDQRYSPVWEGILNLRRPEPGEDAKQYRAECSAVVTDWYKRYEASTGHKVLRVDVHLDEGHMVDGEAVLNAHAHVIADRTNDLGRVIKLSPKQLRELQTMTSQVTNLERGKSSFETGRKHINHQAYKHLAEQGRLETQQVKVKLDKSEISLERQRKLSMEWSDADLQKIKNLQAKIDSEPERLAAALAAQKIQSDEQYRLEKEALETKYKADREDYKNSTEKKTQQDYQALKAVHLSELDALAKAHASDLADLQTKLATAQTEAAKVPQLVDQVNTLKPKAEQVQGLEQELAQLKAQYQQDRDTLKATGEATQRDYQQLKKAHEAELAEAQAQASKVPQLEAQITQLAPLAAKVQGLEMTLKSTQKKVDEMDEYTKNLSEKLADANKKIATA